MTRASAPVTATRGSEVFLNLLSPERFQKTGVFLKYQINCLKKNFQHVFKSRTKDQLIEKKIGAYVLKKRTNTGARAKLSEQKSANDVLKRFLNDC